MWRQYVTVKLSILPCPIEPIPVCIPLPGSEMWQPVKIYNSTNRPFPLLFSLVCARPLSAIMFFFMFGCPFDQSVLSCWTKWNDNNSIIYALCPCILAISRTLHTTTIDWNPPSSRLVCHFLNRGVVTPCGVIYVLSVCLQFVQIGYFVFMVFG